MNYSQVIEELTTSELDFYNERIHLGYEPKLRSNTYNLELNNATMKIVLSADRIESIEATVDNKEVIFPEIGTYIIKK